MMYEEKDSMATPARACIAPLYNKILFVIAVNTQVCVQKRIEPMIKPSALQCKSWDCLPLLTMEVSATRHKDNAVHHKHLKESTMMQLTLIAAYNMTVPPEEELVYTAITKTPLYCEFVRSISLTIHPIFINVILLEAIVLCYTQLKWLKVKLSL